MFSNMLPLDKEMTSPTPVESLAVETPDFGNTDDEDCAIAGKLSMVVEKMDVVINNSGSFHLKMKMTKQVTIARIYPT